MTLTVDENAQTIRSIKSFGNDEGSQDFHFFDANGEKVAFYDPYNNFGKADRVYTEFHLAANERLIGIYGAGIEDCSVFKNFGFIIRVQNYD